MVDIPVEKKNQGTPWWVWLLVLIVIGGLAWYFLDGRDERATPGNNATATTTDSLATAPAATGATGVQAITTIGELSGDTVGRSVSLMNVRVLSADETGGVVIGDDNGQSVFVSTSIPSGFAAGSRVNVTGTVQAGNTPTAGQTAPPAGLPSDATHYIEAYSIQPA